MKNRVRERGETSLSSGVDGPLSYCGEFQAPNHNITVAPIIKTHKIVGNPSRKALVESELVKKIHNQWCKDNGYQIKKKYDKRKT